MIGVGLFPELWDEKGWDGEERIIVVRANQQVTEVTV
jgi:hypothetical protein